MLLRMKSSCELLGLQIAAPAALGLAALFAGQVGGAVTMLGLAALAGLTFYLWWAALPCSPPVTVHPMSDGLFMEPGAHASQGDILHPSLHLQASRRPCQG